jgi:hypothetical protein
MTHVKGQKGQGQGQSQKVLSRLLAVADVQRLKKLIKKTSRERV